MKIRRGPLAAVLMSILCSLASAQESALGAAQNWEALLRSWGYSELVRETRDSRTTYAGTGSSGKIVLEIEGAVSRKTQDAAAELFRELKGWRSIVPGSASMTISGNEIRYRIVPSRLVYNSKDLLQNVPAGMVFVDLGNGQAYDFRLKAENYFIRFQGRVTGESYLLEKMAEAAADPAKYIRENDPSYNTYRIGELQDELDLFKDRSDLRNKRFEETVSALADRDRELALLLEKADSKIELVQTQGLLLLREEASKTEQARIDLEKRLNEKIAASEARISELEAKASALEAHNKALEAETRLMNAAADHTAVAAVAALSKGLFGAPKPPAAEAIAKIREIKKANPATTSAEISTALKAQSIVATEKQIKAVLAVYFGEY
jgi:hypothetical protein